MKTHTNIKQESEIPKFVSYIRVSDVKQGKSGLGLEDQETSIQSYVESQGGILIAVYKEVESGKINNRKELMNAISKCKDTGATLLVKKIDRLSRGGFAVAYFLEEAKVNYIDVTSPNDDSLIKNIKFLFAKDERENISRRTKDALGVLKQRIEKNGFFVSSKGNVRETLGNPQNFTPEARAVSP